MDNYLINCEAFCSLIITPIVTYSEPGEQKSKILSENNNKSGIYWWTNLKNGFSYLGSSINLGPRLRCYFNYKYLSEVRSTSVINRALLKHGYTNFSLEILEYCAKEETFSREQYYLNLLNPEYNIQEIAGEYKGYNHPDDVRKLMSESRRGINNPFFGKTHSKETIALMSVKAKNRTKCPVPGFEVEIMDLETNLTTTYDSIRKAAKVIDSDIKSLSRHEKLKLEKGSSKPYRNRYVINVKRS